MLASRWALIVFYFGLAFALVLYGVAFIYKCIKLTMSIFTLTDNQVILAMLGLIDAALVASLMVMVMLTGYENYVSRLERAQGELTWLGKIDTGSLKVKIASCHRRDLIDSPAPGVPQRRALRQSEDHVGDADSPRLRPQRVFPGRRGPDCGRGQIEAVTAKPLAIDAAERRLVTHRPVLSCMDCMRRR